MTDLRTYLGPPVEADATPARGIERPAVESCLGTPSGLLGLLDRKAWLYPPASAPREPIGHVEFKDATLSARVIAAPTRVVSEGGHASRRCNPDIGAPSRSSGQALRPGCLTEASDVAAGDISGRRVAPPRRAEPSASDAISIYDWQLRDPELAVDYLPERRRREDAAYFAAVSS